MIIVLVIFGAYLLGSIPTAVWLGKFTKGIDIREHGSQNAGATNSFRVLGKRAGWTVLFIDVTKGVFAVLMVYLIPTELFLGFKDELLILKLIGGFVAVFGHVFPVFANFKGGKGVATSLGIVLGINPSAAIVCLSIFLIVFLSTRFVSLGAIISALCFPMVSYFIIENDTRIMIVFTVILGVLVIWDHNKNIKRLLNGTENRMNLFAKKT